MADEVSLRGVFLANCLHHCDIARVHMGSIHSIIAAVSLGQWQGSAAEAAGNQIAGHHLEIVELLAELDGLCADVSLRELSAHSCPAEFWNFLA